jgi:hypothetical protein
MAWSLDAGIGDTNGDINIAVFAVGRDFPLVDTGVWRVAARQQAARKRRATTVPTIQSIALVAAESGSAGVSRR